MEIRFKPVQGATFYDKKIICHGEECLQITWGLHIYIYIGVIK